VVTSGDYQRYYELNGVRYSHIISPDTLQPARFFRAVTVVHPDSATADMLSTALFMLPQKEGEALAAKYGAECLWVKADGSYESTAGYRALSQNFADPA
jgi:thiamine biosynthesis lipoprotein